jgi:hypothetical protein
VLSLCKHLSETVRFFFDDCYNLSIVMIDFDFNSIIDDSNFMRICYNDICKLEIDQIFMFRCIKILFKFTCSTYLITLRFEVLLLLSYFQ